jgi:hypothetical protein
VTQINDWIAIYFSVTNLTPQERREERIFIVFPEPPKNSSIITERAPVAETIIEKNAGLDAKIAPNTDKSDEEEEEEDEGEEAEEEGDEEEGGDEDAEVDDEEAEAHEHPEKEAEDEDSGVKDYAETQVTSRSDDDGEELSKTSSAVTTEAPTTTTLSPTSTTSAAATTTLPTSTTTTAAPSSTARIFRGTPRAPKNKLSTSTAAPVTTSKAPVKNTTGDSSLESEESKELTTHKTPHFEVAKKEKTPILKPATRPSARLVEFLKNKKPGSGKRFQLHPSPEGSTTDPSTTDASTTTATTTTTTSTASPETTTKARRSGAFGSRGKTKMLEKSASEIHAVAIAPPESGMETRRARFFSSASSMLSGFVPAVPMPRISAQMVTRNSRASCANPAGCISPEAAEVLMTSVQETIKNSTQVQTPVSVTTSAVRNKIQSRRNNPPRRRTTAAPPTTADVVTIKSAALRLAQRRRPAAGATTSNMMTMARSSATTSMPVLITMKQIHDIVVTPAPIMVAHGHEQSVFQEATTFVPLIQRFKGLEKRVNPVASLHAQIRPQMQSV